MLAAVVRAFGEPPEATEFQEPPAGAHGSVVDVTAAALNPIDLRIASGSLAARRPQLPYVPGSEGIGRVDGRRVYFDQCVPPFGALAERALIDPTSAVDVPGGVDDAHALCYGVAGLAAWLALERRGRLAEGETALILGASGIVGLIAVQAARLMGAGRVVAAARSEDGLRRARDAGADTTVRLAGTVADMTDAMREAAPDGVDVVLDPLWGEPAAAALPALNARGRLVQLGQSAGATATLASVDIRFKEIEIVGHTNFAAPADVRHDALRRMWEHAAAGRLNAPTETVALTDVADAWARQAASPHAKLVVVPQPG